MALAIAWSGGPDGPYNITFRNFTEDTLPRTYDGSSSIERSTTGAIVISGLYRQKSIWNISARVTADEARAVDDVFRSWDASRAAGNAAAVGILDETGPYSYSGSAVFSTPPEYQRSGPGHYIVTFGLTEV